MRQSGYYWVLPDEYGQWSIAQYDVNWDQWRFNGQWGFLDDEFFRIDERKLIRVK